MAVAVMGRCFTAALPLLTFLVLLKTRFVTLADVMSSGSNGSEVPSAITELESLVDGVMVINLENRPRRWAQMLVELGRVNLFTKAERWGAVDAVRGIPESVYNAWQEEHKLRTQRGGPKVPMLNSMIACALSHFSVLQEAKKRGWNSVLILEDDVIFPVDNEADLMYRLRRVADQLRRVAESSRNGDWEMLHLGSSRCHREERTKRDPRQVVVRKSNECWLTHAVAFQGRGIEMAIDEWPRKKLPADTFYVHLMTKLNAWAVIPPLALQRIGVSSINPNRGLFHRFPIAIPASICHEDITRTSAELQVHTLAEIVRDITGGFTKIDSPTILHQSLNLHQVGSFEKAIAMARNFISTDTHTLLRLQGKILLSQFLYEKALRNDQPYGEDANLVFKILHGILTAEKENTGEEYRREHKELLATLLATCQTTLGMLSILRSDVDGAIRWFKQSSFAAPAPPSQNARAMLSKCQKVQYMQHGINIGSLGALWLFLGDFNAAKIFLHRAKELIDVLYSESSDHLVTPSILHIHTNIALLNFGYMRDRKLRSKTILQLKNAVNGWGLLVDARYFIWLADAYSLNNMGNEALATVSKAENLLGNISREMAAHMGTAFDEMKALVAARFTIYVSDSPGGGPDVLPPTAGIDLQGRQALFLSSIRIMTIDLISGAAQLSLRNDASLLAFSENKLELELEL